MADLQELYQQIIIDHSQHPHNFRALEQANLSQEGFNPLCGDRLTVYLHVQDDLIQEISFRGTGCAISTASASLMSDAVRGKTIAEFNELFNEFQQLVTSGDLSDAEKLGKLATLAGVAEYPMRVKCATLPWHTLKQALDKFTTGSNGK